jgi:hypothetical protein
MGDLDLLVRAKNSLTRSSEVGTRFLCDLSARLGDLDFDLDLDRLD